VRYADTLALEQLQLRVLKMDAVCHHSLKGERREGGRMEEEREGRGKDWPSDEMLDYGTRAACSSPRDTLISV